MSLHQKFCLLYWFFFLNWKLICHTAFSGSRQSYTTIAKLFATLYNEWELKLWEYKKNCSEQQLWSKINSMRTKDTSRRRKNSLRLWLDKRPHEQLKSVCRMLCWHVKVDGKVVGADGKSWKRKLVKVYKWCENL